MCIKNNNILTVCLSGSISKSTFLLVSIGTNKSFSTVVSSFSNSKKLYAENSYSTITTSALPLKQVEAREQTINPQMKPYTATGYFEGDGCFNLSVYKNPKVKTGYSVSFSAELKQNMQS